MSPAIEFIRTHSDDPNYLSFVGTFNYLSPHLIVSELESKYQRVFRHGSPDFWLDVPSPKEPVKTFQIWENNRPLEQKLITIEVLPESPFNDADYRAWNSTKTWVLPLLQKNSNYKVTHQITFCDAVLCLTLWRRGQENISASPPH